MNDLSPASGGCPFGDAVFPFARDADHPLDPPPQFALLRRDHPVSKVKLWNGNEVWLITRFADARAVLRDERFSSQPGRPGYPLTSPGNSAFKRGRSNFKQFDPPEHTAHRRMWAPFFTPRHVQDLKPAVQAIVDDLIDRMMAAGASADLVAQLALPVPSHVVIGSLLGLPASDHAFIHENTLIRGSLGSTVEQVAEATKKINDYWAAIVAQRDRQPGSDLVSQIIVNEVHSGRLSNDELIGALELILIAGHDSTASMIGLGTLSLLQHPAQMEALRRDPGLIPGAVEELLRYHSIAHNGLGRTALADVEIGGCLIRAGDGVLVLISAANRDPQAFAAPDAELFDASRDARHHLAFGAGIHQCIGAFLARSELQIVFETLLRRLPGLRLAVDARELRYRDTLFFGLAALPVQWDQPAG